MIVLIAWRGEKSSRVLLIFDFCLALQGLFVGMPGFPLLFGFSVFIHIVVNNGIVFLSLDYRCHIVLPFLDHRSRSQATRQMTAWNAYGVTNSHDFEVPFFLLRTYAEVLPGCPRIWAISSTVYVLLSRGVSFVPFHVWDMRTPFSYERKQHEYVWVTITSTIILPCCSVFVCC